MPVTPPRTDADVASQVTRTRSLRSGTGSRVGVGGDGLSDEPEFGAGAGAVGEGKHDC